MRKHTKKGEENARNTLKKGIVCLRCAPICTGVVQNIVEKHCFYTHTRDTRFAMREAHVPSFKK